MLEKEARNWGLSGKRKQAKVLSDLYEIIFYFFSFNQSLLLMDGLKALAAPKNYDKFDKRIVDKEFLLGKFYDTTVTSLVSPACKGKHSNIKKFPKSKMRKLLESQLKIHQILNEGKSEKLGQVSDSKIGKKEPKSLEYEFYLPLNRLWCRYMVDLIQKQKNQQSRELKILRADFHGAFITVVDSKNETLIGLEGLVIKETLRSFQIVVKREGDDGKKNVRTILKDICIFLLQVNKDFTFIINGSSIIYRPSDRIRHKFKFKKADQINHQFLTALAEIRQQAQNEKKEAMDIES